MTFTLHLGVIEKPYAVEAPRRARVKVRKGKIIQSGTVPASGAQTIGDVAQILEDKYHVMETFYTLNQQEIADSLAQTMTDALDMLIDSGQAPSSIFPVEGQGDIQKEFNDFIDNKVMDNLVHGVPTGAAQRGVNHRLKIKKGPARPSFKDTGAYEGAFRAWVDQE